MTAISLVALSARVDALAAGGGRGAFTISPLADGGVGGGVADDTAAVRAAADALATAGGGILDLSASHKVSETINVTGSNIAFVGAGEGFSAIIPAFDGDVFNCTGQFYLARDFQVSYSAPPTSGNVFVFANGNAKLNRMTVLGAYGVANFTGGVQTFVTDCTFDNIIGNGLIYGPAYAGWAYGSGVNIGNGSPTSSAVGILIQGGDTFNFVNCNIAQCYIGVLAQPPAGVPLKNLYFANILCDGAGLTASSDMWVFDGSAAGASIARIFLANCWGASGLGSGFRFADVLGAVLTAPMALNNGFHGIALDGAANSHIDIIGGFASGNSQSGSALYDGIRIGAGTTDFKINSVNACPIPYGIDVAITDQQGWGANVEDGPGDRGVVVHNNFHGNLTGGFYNGATGTNMIVGPNLT